MRFLPLCPFCPSTSLVYSPFRVSALDDPSSGNNFLDSSLGWLLLQLWFFSAQATSSECPPWLCPLNNSSATAHTAVSYWVTQFSFLHSTYHYLLHSIYHYFLFWFAYVFTGCLPHLECKFLGGRESVLLTTGSAVPTEDLVNKWVLTDVCWMILCGKMALIWGLPICNTQ